MPSYYRQQILELTERLGLLRPRDLEPLGIPRTYLSRMVEQGELVRLSRGLYALPGELTSEHQSLAEAAKRVPGGVICLLSALRFHDLGTQNPFEIWITIGEKDHKPKVDYPPLRVVRFSGRALEEGVEAQQIDGVSVKVYNPAKTVADCFKYRNKIGLDVALEALRDCWGRKRCSMDDLWHYAEICRVQNVMRPYLEALIA